MAELGGRSEWIIANIRGLATGEVEANELIKLDSVGSYKEYRGDVGRSVFCGEPTPEMLQRSQAVTLAMQTAYEHIRPGKLFRDVVQLTLEAVHKAGFPGFLIAGPHSVGIEHTDHPTSVGPEMPRPSYADLRGEHGLHAGHALSRVRLGTTHVEDMMIVRKNGCEPITSMDTALRVKPLV